MKEIFNIGIIGAGYIAEEIARTLSKMENANAYAIASRNIEKARSFAEKWNVKKAYGSYEDLLKDEEIDLVYIATPHSHHYEHAKLSLSYNKPTLCEKSFTANSKQATELISLSKEKNIFLGEAIWTRYMPFSKEIIKIINDDKVIGNPMLLTATLGYAIADKERIMKPELCGGALLDLGVYTINLARMIFGYNHNNIMSCCTKNQYGVDIQNSITISYPDNKLAVLHSTASCASNRHGIISGDKGYIIIDNINNPQKITVYNSNHEIINTVCASKQISGYEYEFIESIECIKKGMIEPYSMPHNETLTIMQIMDSLRHEWGVVYPADNID